MNDSGLWRFTLLNSILELIIIVVVCIIIIVIYPALWIFVILGGTGAYLLVLWITSRIYKPVFNHPTINPQDEIIGMTGVTITDLGPKLSDIGQIKIRTRVWSGRSNSNFIPSGTKIKVIEMKGIYVIVQAIQE